MIVTVEFHKTSSRILSKRMNLLHVAKGFYILGNRGLKCEQMGVIMVKVEDCTVGYSFISSYFFVLSKFLENECTRVVHIAQI